MGIGSCEVFELVLALVCAVLALTRGARVSWARDGNLGLGAGVRALGQLLG